MGAAEIVANTEAEAAAAVSAAALAEQSAREAQHAAEILASNVHHDAAEIVSENKENVTELQDNQSWMKSALETPSETVETVVAKLDEMKMEVESLKQKSAEFLSSTQAAEQEQPTPESSVVAVDPEELANPAPAQEVKEVKKKRHNLL